MKKLIIILFFTMASAVCFSQSGEEIKMPLFLGSWEIAAEGTVVVEKWIAVNDNEYAGKVYEIKNIDTTLMESVRLIFQDDKLYYCPTVYSQNNSSEIKFELVKLENYGTKFTFENKEHDFPSRIIYDFESDFKLNAKIEGMLNGEYSQIYFPYTKIFRLDESYKLTGIIRKQNFINQGGRKIENVFDYFFEIRGLKYFIKLRDSGITRDEIEKYIDKPAEINFIMLNGLWDSDDPNHQSRIGKYIIIISITE